MNLAPLIDHTLLLPHATREDVERLCKEAEEAGFAAVCVLPSRVGLAADLLINSSVAVCTVIGFPLGAQSPEIKAAEVRQAKNEGAEEVDMVINIGWIKDGNWSDVDRDIACVRRASKGLIMKVIFETGLLTEAEKIHLARLCSSAGVDFVKTSTGSTHGGATVEDIALLKNNVSPKVRIKASGGIKTADQARAMVAAGASRIGTSYGLGIVGNTVGSTGSY